MTLNQGQIRGHRVYTHASRPDIHHMKPMATIPNVNPAAFLGIELDPVNESRTLGQTGTSCFGSGRVIAMITKKIDQVMSWVRNVALGDGHFGSKVTDPE